MVTQNLIDLDIHLDRKPFQFPDQLFIDEEEILGDIAFPLFLHHSTIFAFAWRRKEYGGHSTLTLMASY
jgi:hypothetical protein